MPESQMQIVINYVLDGVIFILGLIISLWWVFVPIILAIFAWDLWIKFVRTRTIQNAEWVLLEIVPPREIQKTPQAMEQVFATIHGSRGSPNWWDRHRYGMTQSWFSMEIIGQSGAIHFLVRTTTRFRDLVEAAIYAQYPGAEIYEVDDYIHSVPADLPNDNYDVVGGEMVLGKEDAYPIRTYIHFEKLYYSEEMRTDPMAALLETMSKLQPGEQLWVQTLIRPVKDVWKKEGEAIRDKIMGRVEKAKKGFVSEEGEAWGRTIGGALGQLVTGQPPAEVKKEEEKEKDPKLTQVERDVLKALEENIGKIGFETIIRFIYVAPKEIARGGPVRNALMGFYAQFTGQHLNSLKRLGAVDPTLDYWYELAPRRNFYRNKRLFSEYRRRYFVQYSKAIDYLKPLSFERLPILKWFFIRSQPFIFNIEELATIYHFPAITVQAPLTPKVEAKKGEPPMKLPVKE